QPLNIFFVAVFRANVLRAGSFPNWIEDERAHLRNDFAFLHSLGRRRSITSSTMPGTTPSSIPAVSPISLDA
ncbi:MAG: hypothetical protein WBD81_07915, partial [Collimonas pratensis]|uniref:hypothetical protein n=1 Tax=Collimonas pratensis TaxID=279113 RepID=UPI003C72E19E